jgi:hypothetical protein
MQWPMVLTALCASEEDGTGGHFFSLELGSYLVCCVLHEQHDHGGAGGAHATAERGMYRCCFSTHPPSTPIQQASHCPLSSLQVSVKVGMVEAYDGPLHVALALHACGNATDYALLQVRQAMRLAFVVVSWRVG